MRLRLVGLDIRNRTRLTAPRMVDQQFCIHAEHAVQQFFVIKFIRFSKRAADDIAHCGKSLCLEFFRNPVPDAPEIGQRPVLPERFTIAALGEAGDAHAVFIRLHMLGLDVHGDFGQIQIRADPGGCGDAGCAQNIQNDCPRQFLRRLAVGA